MAVRSVVVVEFDFQNRKERVIPIEDARAACDKGLSCWVDIDADDCDDPGDAMRQFRIPEMAIEQTLTNPLIGRHDMYHDCLHVTVAAPRVEEDRVEFDLVDLIIGERFIISVRRGRVLFMAQARSSYKQFFRKFAQTLGFLLFELWDHLIDNYRETFRALENRVEAVQGSIFGNVDDAIFNRVSDITHDLLVLRRNLFANREVLHQLAMHKSTFVSETTQPYLQNMVGTLERLGNDLAVEREILTDTLTLYLGIVSHRTNAVINRLTVISVIFLPLTFLVGVYGMNFESQPEFKWEYGYVFFWIVAGAIVAGLVALMKFARWL